MLMCMDIIGLSLLEPRKLAMIIGLKLNMGLFSMVIIGLSSIEMIKSNSKDKSKGIHLEIIIREMIEKEM